MRISDWSSDVCSSDLRHGFEYQTWLGFSLFAEGVRGEIGRGGAYAIVENGTEEPAMGFSLYIDQLVEAGAGADERRRLFVPLGRSEEHTSELQSLMRISYAVFCLKKKHKNTKSNKDRLSKESLSISRD